jgi:hypothetical protein
MANNRELSCLDEETLKDFRTQLNIPKSRRSVLKRKVTIIFKKLMSLRDDSRLKPSLLKVEIPEIELILRQIEELNDKMLDIFEKFNIGIVDEQYLENEVDEQQIYRFNIHSQMDEFNNFMIATDKGDVSENEENLCTSVFSDKVLKALNNLKFSEGKPPPLQCGTFEGSEDDKHSFANFYGQFKNVIGNRKDLSKSAKLAYLHGYLRGYAYNIVKHLTINDDNYDKALKLLEDEFYDVSLLIDDSFKKLIELSPGYDQSFNSTRLYINEIRSLVFELRNYELDFLEADTAGCALLSHIVFSKLPNILKRELVHKVGTNYPTLDDIFDNYAELIKTITSTTKARSNDSNNWETF